MSVKKKIYDFDNDVFVTVEKAEINQNKDNKS